MKIRNGFVSNSSSSSFVLIVSKDNYEKVLSTLGPLEKDVTVWLAKKTFVGNSELVVFEGSSGDAGYTFDNYDPGDGKTEYKKQSDEEGEEYLPDLWDGIKEKLMKDKNHFYSSQLF